MRPRTGLALAVTVLALAGVAVLALSGGGTAALSVVWVSDTGTDIRGNHHAVAAAEVEAERYVVAPISGRAGTTECRLAGLDATDGETVWRVDVAPENCTIHSVADPTVADVDGDGRPEVLATTTGEVLLSVDPATGEAETLATLSSYGYTEPVVANLTGAGREVVVVDYQGTVVVVGPDGEERLNVSGARGVEAQPRVADVDGDGRQELAVASTSGGLTVRSGNGTVEWRHGADADAAPISLVVADADGPGRLLAYTTFGGDLVAVRDGETVWRRSFGEVGSVEAAFDGDDDGTVELYLGTADGRVRALSADDGATEWSTTVTDADVQVTPGPVAGDLDGDGAPELVAASNDGSVTTLDPEDGRVLATYERDVPIYVHRRVADVDGDGDDEALVVYGDGRVVALSLD